jgi:phospholipid/cholesterol/gamma-HCH transport system ATP-binding protein
MSAPVPNVVEISKLWTVFSTPQAELVIHKDLDLSVSDGEVLSLVGGSGSGKTTLLRQMLGLETPARGSIRGQPHWHAVPAWCAVLGL